MLRLSCSHWAALTGAAFPRLPCLGPELPACPLTRGPQRPSRHLCLHFPRVNLTHRPVPIVAGIRRLRSRMEPIRKKTAIRRALSCRIEYPQCGSAIELTYLEDELAIYITERNKIHNRAKQNLRHCTPACVKLNPD